MYIYLYKIIKNTTFNYVHTYISILTYQITFSFSLFLSALLHAYKNKKLELQTGKKKICYNSLKIKIKKIKIKLLELPLINASFIQNLQKKKKFKTVLLKRPQQKPAAAGTYQQYFGYFCTICVFCFCFNLLIESHNLHAHFTQSFPIAANIFSMKHFCILK